MIAVAARGLGRLMISTRASIRRLNNSPAAFVNVTLPPEEPGKFAVLASRKTLETTTRRDSRFVSTFGMLLVELKVMGVGDGNKPGITPGRGFQCFPRREY